MAHVGQKLRFRARSLFASLPCRSGLADVVFQSARLILQGYVGLRETAVEPTRLQEERGEHEARRHESVNAASVEAQVKTPGVEEPAEGDVEQPGAHNDHEPEVKHHRGTLPPQDHKRDQAQGPHGRQHERLHRCIAVASHDAGQEVLSYSGQQREGAHHANYGDNTADGIQSAQAAGRCTDPTVTLLQCTLGYYEEREAPVPEHIEPSGGLGPRSQ